MLVMKRTRLFLAIFMLVSFLMIVGVQVFAAEGKTYNWKMAQYHACLLYTSRDRTKRYC